MDVTSDTVAAGSLLSGKTATKNDGTKVTGNIASKSSSDLTVSGATVTAPAGYYANAASKAVATTTHPNPTATIASSTGVVTASHTQGTGYVTGGTTTGTLNLTTQAGKTVTPTESAQTAVASYRWTTGPVSVAAISSTYVGTGVARKSAADLTASGSVVTTPIGYYSSAVSKAVAAGSAFPPAVTITKAPTISMVSSTGVITASYTGSSSVTPTVNAGYVSQGTAGTISTTGTSTYTLTTQGAQTITPGSTAQTIASNRWLTGTQTIAGDSNLVAENIAEGVSIFGVTGTHSGGGYTCTITGTGHNTYCKVTYNNIAYISSGEFNFNSGDEIILNISAYRSNGQININNEQVVNTQSSYTYTLVAPACDIAINLAYGQAPTINVTIPTISITENGTHEVGGYGFADVDIQPYTATFLNNHIGSTNVYFTYNGIKSTELGDSFTFHAGDTIVFTCPSDYESYIQENYNTIARATSYTYTLPAYDIEIEVWGQAGGNILAAYLRIHLPQIDITENGKYNVCNYGYVNVLV